MVNVFNVASMTSNSDVVAVARSTTASGTNNNNNSQVLSDTCQTVSATSQDDVDAVSPTMKRHAGSLHHHHHHHHHHPCKYDVVSRNFDESQMSTFKQHDDFRTDNFHTNIDSFKPDQRRCAVCKDVASGYHYGVWSCEGCKAFFKRSIQGPCDYICPATNTCTIDKHRRKSCQACRLRTCYEVGMSKGSTRRERRPYRRKSSITNNSTGTASNDNGTSSNQLGSVSSAYMFSVNNAGGSGSQHYAAVQKLIRQQQQHDGMISSADGRARNTGLKSEDTQGSASKAEQSLVTDYVQVLVNLEYNPLPVRLSSNNAYHLQDKVGIMKSLAILFDKELVYLINWAKCIPDYTQLLIEDQIRLIESGWLEVLVLNYVKHSMSVKETRVFFAPDFIVESSQLNAVGLSDIADGFLSLAHEFYLLDMSVAQFSALKVVCFLNSTNRMFDVSLTLQQLRMNAVKALKFVCNVGNVQVVGRVEQMLLLLPHLKSLSLRLLTHLLSMRNDIPNADLLHEMLDAHDTVNSSLEAKQRAQNESEYSTAKVPAGLGNVAADQSSMMVVTPTPQQRVPAQHLLSQQPTLQQNSNVQILSSSQDDAITVAPFNRAGDSHSVVSEHCPNTDISTLGLVDAIQTTSYPPDVTGVIIKSTSTDQSGYLTSIVNAHTSQPTQGESSNVTTNLHIKNEVHNMCADVMAISSGNSSQHQCSPSAVATKATHHHHSSMFDKEDEDNYIDAVVAGSEP